MYHKKLFSECHVFIVVGHRPHCLFPVGEARGQLPPEHDLHHHRVRDQPEERDQGSEEGAVTNLDAGSVRCVRQDGAEDQQVDREAGRSDPGPLRPVLQGELGLHHHAARHPRPHGDGHHVELLLHASDDAAPVLDLARHLVHLSAHRGPWRCGSPSLDGTQLRLPQVSSENISFPSQRRIQSAPPRLDSIVISQMNSSINFKYSITTDSRSPCRFSVLNLRFPK